MPNHAVTAAGEAMPAETSLQNLSKLLKAGDVQGALLMLSAIEDSTGEKPVDKVNRLGWELAHALNQHGDGMFKAVVYPTLVRPEFAVGFCVLNLPKIHDPLLDAIQDYRDGCTKFEAIPESELSLQNEETLIMGTYGAPLDVLEAWDQPARTREGAIEALKLIDEKMPPDSIPAECGMMIGPLLSSVRCYLESLQESVPLVPPHPEGRLSRIKTQIAELNDHDELNQLFKALMTIGDVLNNVGQHPKFWADRSGAEYTPAGKVLDALNDAFDFIIDDVVKRVKELPAPTRHDRDLKALTLGAWEIFCGSVPNEIIATLAPLATDTR